ncbi:MAG TPA: immunoglobulin domain-containing protein [Candidatus Paceibacterota bacterium]|nr:immunoglobulin domain-containing protein [Candidatus Paceibacterota bacterium]
MKSILSRVEPARSTRVGAIPLKASGAAMAVFLAMGIATANELINGKLDTIAVGPQNNPTPTGWTVEATKAISGTHYDGCSSEPWCNVLDIGGYGLFFKPFQGSIGDEITVHFYQDNPASPGTKYTLSGYAAGEANYCGFFTTNSPPPQTLFVIQFLDAGNSVIASNGFDLVAAGLPSSGPGSMQSFLFTTPQVTAPPNAAVVRVGASMINAYSTSGAQSFFVDAFELLSEAPPGAPVITNQPKHTTVSAGATAVFTVGVSNPAGVSYQWQFNGANLSDGGKISGANTATLTVTDVSASEVGRYRVRLTNAGGSVLSSEATLAIVGINFYPVISITGKIGDTYRVDYSTALEPATWIPLSTNVLTSSPQLILDATSPGDNTRFYRAVLLQ